MVTLTDQDKERELSQKQPNIALLFCISFSCNIVVIHFKPKKDIFELLTNFQVSLLQIKQNQFSGEDKDHGNYQGDGREIIKKDVERVCLASKIHDYSKVCEMKAVTGRLGIIAYIPVVITSNTRPVIFRQVP